MTMILTLTVGGSCVPIITAVRDYGADFVCFIATGGTRGSRATVDGPGKPCGRGPDAAPNIITQLSLPEEQYRVVELEDPDTLPQIYAVCKETCRALKDEFPAARHIADYTGGSKSMGVGLALAALESGWELSLVRGQRPDLVKVADGTEMASLVNSWEVRARQRMEEARHLFNAYAYASAAQLLAELMRQAPLSTELNHRIRDWVTFCRGFDAWDRFDHAGAVQILRTVQSQIVPQWIFLKKLTGQTRGTGYEPVLDLVHSAERRAARGRFDDAVARLYRAIELLAQTRLGQREPPLDSGNLDLERLPDGIRPRYERMRELSEMQGRGPEVKLGLMDDYVLLAELDDPLGRIFAPMRNRLLDVLQKRNQSILAHGGEPLDRTDYDNMLAIAWTLIKDGLKALDIPVSVPHFPLLGSNGIIGSEEN
jgi:hypothetical protein